MPFGPGRGGGGRGGGFGGFGGGKGGKGGGKGGRGGKGYDDGPPERVEEVGKYMHECEGEMVCKLTNEKVPYFNAPIYIDKDTKIGKVDEVFGPINAVMFTVKTDAGVNSKSFQLDDKVCIAPDKLLPMSRFTSPSSGGGLTCINVLRVSNGKVTPCSASPARDPATAC